MNLIRRETRLVNFPTAREAVAELAEPFAGDEGAGGRFVPDCEEVQPAAMTPAERRLLAHREHMTVVLEDHHHAPMHVHVQQAFHDGDHYTRKILLTPTDRGGTVVEAGIVRLHFHYMDDAVRDEILSQRAPLGAILIRHDVLRRIEPLWFLRFPPNSNVLKLHGIRTEAPTFGRVGMIYCNDEPAVEVLEVVLNV